MEADKVTTLLLILHGDAFGHGLFLPDPGQDWIEASARLKPSSKRR